MIILHAQSLIGKYLSKIETTQVRQKIKDQMIVNMGYIDANMMDIEYDGFENKDDYFKAFDQLSDKILTRKNKAYAIYKAPLEELESFIEYFSAKEFLFLLHCLDLDDIVGDMTKNDITMLFNIRGHLDSLVYGYKLEFDSDGNVESISRNRG